MNIRADQQMGIISIIAVCSFVLLIVAMKKKSELLVNFILRSIIGTIAIYFINEILMMQGYSLYAIGINGVNVLTSGILGFPGLFLLYGIKIYVML